MGVDDAADLRKLAIKKGVGIQVARWAQGTVDNLAIKIGDHQVFGAQGGVIHPTGFNHHQRLVPGAVDAAGIAEGMRGEATAGDLAIGLMDLFAEGGKQHGSSQCGKAFTGTSLALAQGNSLSHSGPWHASLSNVFSSPVNLRLPPAST